MTELAETKLQADELLAAFELAAAPAIAKCTLESVEDLENKIVGADVNQAEEINAVGMKDKLVNGLYARILTIPKGAFLTGKVHKQPYIDIFVSGDITFKSFLENGEIDEDERITSDTVQFFEGKPGRKRVGYAHEDTVWITVDHTQAVHIEQAENDITFFQMKDYHRMLEDKK